MDAAEVLVLTAEKDTAQAVRKAMTSDHGGRAPEVCRSIVEFRSRIARSGPETARRVAIVDIDEHPQQTLFDLSKTVTANPSMVFVVVSREFTEQLVLQAMQAGARHFMRKSTIEKELLTVLDHLVVQKQHGPARLGHIITVFSCSGGCGATTVAVNVAAELRESPDRTALLIDLDPHYGSVAHHLNLTGKYGIGHILRRDDAIDRHLIESSVTPAGARMDVLLSPAAAAADAKTPLNYGNLLKTLDACRETHDYVVVDAPRLPPQALADLATATSVAIVVLRLTVRDVAYARQLIASLTRHGMTPDHIIALANQATRRGPLLGPGEVRKALDPTPLFCVRTDRRRAVRSMNYGLPLVHFARRAGLRHDFRKLAAHVQKWIANGYLDEGGA